MSPSPHRRAPSSCCSPPIGRRLSSCALCLRKAKVACSACPVRGAGYAGTTRRKKRTATRSTAPPLQSPYSVSCRCPCLAQSSLKRARARRATDATPRARTGCLRGGDRDDPVPSRPRLEHAADDSVVEARARAFGLLCLYVLACVPLPRRLARADLFTLLFLA